MIDPIAQFAASYHPFNNISTARAREQVNKLREFEAFAGVPILSSGDQHLRDYLDHLIVVQGLHPNTVRKIKSEILPFFGWCFDRRLVTADTWMRVQRVQNPRGSTSTNLPNPYERKEIRQFWVDLDASWPIRENYLKRWRNGRSRWSKVGSTLMNAQIRAITLLALHAGMRRDEIFNAALRDIHYDNEYVVVRSPARKNALAVAMPRQVPMTRTLADGLQTWFDFRSEVGPLEKEKPWLSLTIIQPRGADWYKRAMSHEKFGELLGKIGPGYELHRMRHTCATEWLRSGMEIERLRDLLGHATIGQTLAYAKIVPDDLARSMNRAAPSFEAALAPA